MNVFLYNDDYYWIVSGNRLLKTFNVRKWSDNKCCARVDNCFTAAIAQIQRVSLNAKQNEAEFF